MQIIKLAAILITTGSLEVFGEQPARRIVVSIPDRKLALIENDRVVKVYPIAVGKAETPSPTGSFRVVSRVIDPTWYTKGKIVPPGPANPLGNRWIGLSERGYGIHGTNVQSSVGHAASHGCIRMRKADVEELFKRVEIGDPVEFRDQVSAIAFGVPQQPAINQTTEAGESQ
jgi:lipoprotein-anchoring transpeptidase ErfK/SrfK